MTLFWYDIETFGRNPQMDRIAQFAGVRTDDKFQVIEKPLIIYCRITPDYLPDPASCLITGITPFETLEKGVSEYEFIKRINEEFSRPGTCVVGYNNLRFDDEFIRNCYYRNFFDPYLREWANNNSRWDIIDLVRITRDLRPGGINWPEDDNGKPIFKLEKLTKANSISHENAHDALSDVHATIALAKLVHKAQPRLFEYIFKNRTKEAVKKHINLHTKKPFLHTSGMFTTERGCTSIVVPLAVDPGNNNCILSYDLRYNPENLLKLPIEEIRRLIFTPAGQLDKNEERIHIKGIHVNKCPVIAPVSTMKNPEKLGIDLDQALRYLKILKQDKLITQKIIKVFEKKSYPDHKDPDLQIYSGGFFKDIDKTNFDIIHNTKPEKLSELQLSFEDRRIPEMLWRFIGRNYPETLNPEEQKKWKSFCAGRILFPPAGDIMDLGNFEKKLKALSLSKEIDGGQKMVIKELEKYKDFIKKEVLDYPD